MGQLNTLIIEEGPLRKNVVYTKVFAHLVYINQIIISAWLMFLWIDMLRLNQYWMMALNTLFVKYVLFEKYRIIIG